MLHSLHAILKGALSEAVEIEADATATESAPQLQVRVRSGPRDMWFTCKHTYRMMIVVAVAKPIMRIS